MKVPVQMYLCGPELVGSLPSLCVLRSTLHLLSLFCLMCHVLEGAVYRLHCSFLSLSLLRNRFVSYDLVGFRVASARTPWVV